MASDFWQFSCLHPRNVQIPGVSERPHQNFPFTFFFEDFLVCLSVYEDVQVWAWYTCGDQGRTCGRRFSFLQAWQRGPLPNELPHLSQHPPFTPTSSCQSPPGRIPLCALRLSSRIGKVESLNCTWALSYGKSQKVGTSLCGSSDPRRVSLPSPLGQYPWLFFQFNDKCARHRSLPRTWLVYLVNGLMRAVGLACKGQIMESSL